MFFFKYVNLHLVATSPIINKVVKLWCLSVPKISCSMISLFQVIFLLHDKCFSFACVYGANTYLVRRILWKDLSFFTGFWCILGDFNVVLSTDDYKGGWLLIRFLVINSSIGLVLMILLVCLLLDLVILDVMGREGYTKFIEN